MRPGRSREISVGVTLMLALVVFAGIILMLGKDSHIFRSTYHYVTTVVNSVGLKSGSPVVMGGVQIGSVSSVRLPEAPGAEGITVELSVDRAFVGRIREGSLASVGFITLLSGEKYINISPGDATKPEMPDGSFIPTDKSLTLLEKGESLAESLTNATSQMSDILDKLSRGEGLVGRILQEDNPYVGQELIDKAGATFSRADRILQDVEQGQGTVGRLLKDEAFAKETLGNLKSASERLERIMASVENREGALGDLTREDGKSKQVIEDLKEVSSSLKAATAKLESQTGLLGRILNDREYSEAVAADLKSSMASLSSILRKIDKGEGSLGAFINNPSVYRGVEDIVGGLGKSRFAKGVIRHYGEKGAKESGKTPPPGEAGPGAPKPAEPKPAEPKPPEPKPGEPSPDGANPQTSQPPSRETGADSGTSMPPSPQPAPR